VVKKECMYACGKEGPMCGKEGVKRTLGQSSKHASRYSMSNAGGNSETAAPIEYSK